MGYTTEFSGKFTFDKPLDNKTLTFLQKFNDTRRMARNVKEYGIEGELYVDGKGFAGQDHEDNIIDYNRPPSTQPSLWCQWRPTDDGEALQWDGGEKFYAYVEWLEYLIKNIITPAGYTLNGTVHWQGEEIGDIGNIVVINNKVKTIEGKRELKKSTKYVKALRVLQKVTDEFPGLLDLETAINGADLIEALTKHINDSKILKKYLKG